MSHRGRPAAAAVVAAPIRNECVEIGARLVEGSAKLRIVVSLRLVRNVPSKYVNNGPVLLRWCANNCFKATIGHNELCWGKANNTSIPKGICFRRFYIYFGMVINDGYVMKG